MFGLITYATYDLTNLATLKDWPLVVTVVDMFWGGILATAVSYLGFLAGRWLSSNCPGPAASDIEVFFDGACPLCCSTKPDSIPLCSPEKKCAWAIMRAALIYPHQLFSHHPTLRRCGRQTCWSKNRC